MKPGEVEIGFTPSSRGFMRSYQREILPDAGPIAA